MQNTPENWLKVAIAILTGIAAAIGAQVSPAARPSDVSAAVREELAPLKVQVEKIDHRLGTVEAIVLAKDATP